MISWNAIDAVLLSLLQYYNFKTISFRWKLEKSVPPQQICFFSSYFVFKRSFVDSHQTDELLIEKKMWNTKTSWKKDQIFSFIEWLNVDFFHNYT